jgi:hypothetical protein
MGSPTPANHGQDTSDTQGGVTYYRLKWTNTSAVSPTFPLSASEGFVSVTYSATGILTIVMQNNAYQYLHVWGTVMQAAYNASTGACGVRLVSESPTTATVVVTLENAAGTAVAGATGDIIEITIVAQNYHSLMG